MFKNLIKTSFYFSDIHFFAMFGKFKSGNTNKGHQLLTPFKRKTSLNELLHQSIRFSTNFLNKILIKNNFFINFWWKNIMFAGGTFRESGFYEFST